MEIVMFEVSYGNVRHRVIGPQGLWLVALGVLLVLFPTWSGALFNNLGAVSLNRCLQGDAGPAVFLWDATAMPMRKQHNDSCTTASTFLILAVHLDPGNPWAWKNLGVLHLVARNLPAAETTLERIAGEGPARRMAWFLLGYVAEFQGNHQTAIVRWRVAEAAWFFSGRALYWRRQGLLDQAVTDVQLALAIDPKLADAPNPLFSEVYFDVARADYAAGRFEKAVAEYSQALSFQPERMELHIYRGLTYLAMGQPEDAETEFLIAADDRNPSTQAWAYRELGVLYLHKGRPEQALDVLTRAVALEPQNGEYHIRLADAYLGLGNTARAKAELEVATQIPGASAQAQAFYALGRIYEENGALSEAEGAYRNALSLGPDMAFIRIGLFRVLQRLGRVKEALAELEQAATSSDHLWQAWAYEELGAFYKEQARWREAIEAYEQAVVLNPLAWDYHARLADAYRIVGRQEDALRQEEIARALRLNEQLKPEGNETFDRIP